MQNICKQASLHRTQSVLVTKQMVAKPVKIVSCYIMIQHIMLSYEYGLSVPTKHQKRQQLNFKVSDYG